VHVVVANGELPLSGHNQIAALLANADRVIAADGGLAHCAAVGHWPDMLVGDLDSAPPPLVAEAVERGCSVVEHPPDKDASDLRLALDQAIGEGAHSITVVAPFGGRLDHELVTIGMLCSADFEHTTMAATDGRRRLWVVRPGPAVALGCTDGETVSLIPWGGDVVGVTTTDLQWPLDQATLPLGSSWGLSNIVRGPAPAVSCTAGVLIATSDSGRS
jgi:thiamine pyrophosphokinase